MSDFGSRLKQRRNEKKMTQKDFAKQLGVTQSTVANYESNFRFPRESRLKKISDVLDIPVDHLLGLDLNAPLDDNFEHQNMNYKSIVEDLIELLLDSKEFECVEAVKMNLKYIPRKSDFVEHVLAPLMVRVGVLWKTGEVDVAQEHYISGVVDRILDLVIVDEAPKPFAKSVILLVPDVEEHILVLKMLKVFFVEAGWRVYLIGKSVPLQSLYALIDREEVDWILISVTMEKSLNSLEYLISAIKKTDSDFKSHIVLGGRAIRDREMAINLLGGDFYFESFQDLKRYIRKAD